MKRTILTILTALLLTSSLLAASAPAAGPDPGAASSASPLTPPATPAVDNGPVAVPEPSAKAVSYHRGGVWIWLFEMAFGLLLPAAFLFSGLSARIRDLAQRIGRRWFLTIAIYISIFSLLSAVIELPISY